MSGRQASPRTFSSASNKGMRPWQHPRIARRDHHHTVAPPPPFSAAMGGAAGPAQRFVALHAGRAAPVPAAYPAHITWI